MKHINKFNESESTAPKTLRELIGDVIETKNSGPYYKIVKTEKGCYSDIDDIEKLMDSEISLHMRGNVGEIYLKSSPEKKRFDFSCYCYSKDGQLRIISTIPGDERGCIEFNGTFIATGHDGMNLWNVDTGEFKSHTT